MTRAVALRVASGATEGLTRAKRVQMEVVSGNESMTPGEREVKAAGERANKGIGERARRDVWGCEQFKG